MGVVDAPFTHPVLKYVRLIPTLTCFTLNSTTMKAMITKCTPTTTGTFCSTVEITVEKTVFGVKTSSSVRALMFTNHELPLNTEDTLSGFKLDSRAEGLPVLVPAL